MHAAGSGHRVEGQRVAGMGVRLPNGEASGVAVEHIGWTPFRHTFASMLAQAGVPLDKINAWMGNSPQVCRRHYAQFVPRGAHDEGIDKL